MVACWTQFLSVEPGDDNQPSDTPDPYFAIPPTFDDTQVVDKLRRLRVILRANITALANTTVRVLESSPSNISMLVDLCGSAEHRQVELRKLYVQIQSLLDFESFVKDLEEDEKYSNMISRTKVLLKEAISQASLRQSDTATRTLSPPQYVDRSPKEASSRRKDAGKSVLHFAINTAFEAAGSAPSREEKMEQHSATTFATSSLKQDAERSGKTKFDEAGIVAFRRSEDIGESDSVRAKPRKPSRIGNRKIKSMDGISSACSESNTFTHASQL